MDDGSGVAELRWVQGFQLIDEQFGPGHEPAERRPQLVRQEREQGGLSDFGEYWQHVRFDGWRLLWKNAQVCTGHDRHSSYHGKCTTACTEEIEIREGDV